MEEAPENGKESPHSAHANGMYEFPSAVPIILVTLILLFLIGVVQLAPQHEVASWTHRSTIN